MQNNGAVAAFWVVYNRDMLRRRDEPCLEVRKAKISRISNQDPFMSFWTYRNSFRIWRFQPDISKNNIF